MSFRTALSAHNTKARVSLLQLFFDPRRLFVDTVKCLRQRFFRDQDYRLRLPGDGIVGLSALHCGQPECCLLRCRHQNTAQQAVGISPALIDLRAGMAALQSLHANLHDRAFFRLNRLPLQRNIHIHPRTAGTACDDDAFLFVVQIDQLSAAQHGQIDALRTCKTRLLLGGHHHFQARMLNILRIQQCQNVSHRNTVITAKTCPFRTHSAVPDAQPQRIFRHINITVRLLHRHHVHMPLQDIWRFLLITGCRLLDDDNVVQCILNALQSPLPGKLFQIIADLLLIAGTVRNTADLLKKVKYACRF